MIPAQAPSSPRLWLALEREDPTTSICQENDSWSLSSGGDVTKITEIRSGVLGEWTEPPEARRRDPRETSDSPLQTRSSQSQHHICWHLSLPLTSSTALQLPTQARANTGSRRPTQAPPSRGRGTGFQPPLVPGPSLSCSCSSRRFPGLRHPVSSWETFLVSDLPWNHGHEEGEAGREEGPALWETSAVAWSTEGHSCHGLTPTLSGLPRIKTHSLPAAREFLGVVRSCSHATVPSKSFKPLSHQRRPSSRGCS